MHRRGKKEKNRNDGTEKETLLQQDNGSDCKTKFAINEVHSFQRRFNYVLIYKLQDDG